jgi:hypothetical protein
VNPEYVTIINTVAFILDKVGTWPVGTVFFVVIIGPWVATFLLNRSQDKKVAAVSKMYEDNVELVRDYKKMAEGFQDLIILNTQAMTNVVTSAEKNLFCPIVRRETQQKEIDR